MVSNLTVSASFIGSYFIGCATPMGSDSIGFATPLLHEPHVGYAPP